MGEMISLHKMVLNRRRKLRAKANADLTEILGEEKVLDLLEFYEDYAPTLKARIEDEVPQPTGTSL